MLCKSLEVGIISEHILVLLARRFFGVYPRFQVALFGMIRMDKVVIRDRETVLHDVLNVNFGRVKQFSYMFVALLFMILVFVPRLYRLSVPLKDYEICI
jgi:hypothetical protein